MAKLYDWFKAHSEAKFRFIHYLLLLYVFFIPLWPKIPFKDVEYTYINIRYEDLFVALLGAVFVIDLLRRKITLKNSFLIWFSLYWAAVFGAFLWGHYISNTIPVFNIGLLHSLRRIEYMFPFFVFFAAIDNPKQFALFVKAALLALFLVLIYAMGQKFIGWPAFLTMNPVFSTGIPLNLTEESRIASTFGGHYDLAAFLVIMIPLTLGFAMGGKKRFFLLFMFALLVLVYTASRTSFIAYIASTMAFLLYVRRWKMAIVVLAVSIVMMTFTRDLTTRFMKTFSIRQILVNNKTGEVFISQKLSKDELPGGSLYVPLKGDQGLPKGDIDKLRRDIIAKKEYDLATAGGNLKDATASATVAAGLSAENYKAVSGVVYDISSATRLQVEWPRAFNAFKSNVVLGTGPSSITEATDNDYLRALGETGALGFALLFGTIAYLQWLLYQSSRRYKGLASLVFLGVVFGAGGLMINALYIDVFEASKIAFFIWFLWAVFYKGSTFKDNAIEAVFARDQQKK